MAVSVARTRHDVVVPVAVPQYRHLGGGHDPRYRVDRARIEHHQCTTKHPFCQMARGAVSCVLQHGGGEPERTRHRGKKFTRS